MYTDAVINFFRSHIINDVQRRLESSIPRLYIINKCLTICVDSLHRFRYYTILITMHLIEAIAYIYTRYTHIRQITYSTVTIYNTYVYMYYIKYASVAIIL